MAVATLTPGWSVINACENITGWSGTNAADTEVFKQGTAGLSSTLRTNGLNQKYYTVTSTSYANTHLRIWFNYAAIGFLDLAVNGGIRFMAYDGTNTGYWYVGGKDTYQGGWELLTIDTAKAFNSGTCNLAAVTRIGFALQLTGAPRNATNTWWDYFVAGNGITITGGNTTDAVTWSTVYDADVTAGYGAVQRAGGVYFCNTNLVFGSSNNIYFEDSNQVIIFEDLDVDTHLYTILPTGSGTTSFKLSNSVIKSESVDHRVDLTFDDSTLDTLTFSGNTIVNADVVKFKSGQTATGSVFQNCNQVVPAGCSFTNNIIRNSVNTTGGALLWPGGTGVQYCTFRSNSTAIEFSTSTITESWIGMLMDSNTTDAKNNNTTATADSYAFTNQSAGRPLGNTDTAVGQSFTGNGQRLSGAAFYLYKAGSPTGNIYAKLYAHSGTFGTDSIPTGSPIATSQPVNVTSIGAWVTVNFTFTSAPTLTASTKYVIVLDYSGGDGSNYISIGIDNTSPSHGGNVSIYTSSWGSAADEDMCFFVYTGAINVAISGNGTAAGLTYSGLPVAFESAATLTLVNVRDGSEVRIYKTGTTEELYGLESKSAGVDPAYSYTNPQAVDIVVHSLNYQYYRLNNYSLASVDTDLPVSQITDRNYKNPT